MEADDRRLAVFFPDQGTISIEMTPGAAQVIKWLELSSGDWEIQTPRPGIRLNLTPPGPGMWIAVVDR